MMDSTRELNRLMNKYLNDNVKLSRSKTSIAVRLVTEKIQKIVKFIHTNDKRFKAEVQCTGSYYQGLKVKAADEFDFNVFLEGFDGLTEWGGGGGGGRGPRYYKFNRDYDRNIAVHVECEFIFPVLPLMAAAAAMGGYFPQPSRSQPIQGGFSSGAGFSQWGQPAGNQPTPRPLPSSQPPPQRKQGPALPPGPPLNMDNLETLPDDLELLPASTPLAEPPEGYKFWEYIPQIPVWQNAKDMVFSGDIVPFYVQRKFKKQLQEALRKIEGFRGEIRQARKVHGPALTLRIQTNDETNTEISVDLAVAIPTKLPIPHENGWPRMGKKWPSQSKIEAVKRAGIIFIARKPYYWQMSYANCEKELIKNIDMEGSECRKDCHRIMKSIRERYWCLETKPVISSYHLKNLLFWECEDHPHSADWATDRLWERFQGTTNRLLRCIAERKLPHYFNPKLNLLAGKDTSILAKERARIEEFMRNPAAKLRKALE